MAKKTIHQVTAALIVARTGDAANSGLYLRRGAVLPASISSDEAKRLVEAGLVGEVEIDVADQPAEPPQIPEGAPATGWTVPQLKAYAEREGVDLGDAKVKPEILAALGVSGD